MATVNLAGKMIEQLPRPGATPLENACIIIPTYNAGKYWDRLHTALKRQGIDKDQILIVDSSSTDNTPDLIRRSGYRMKKIRSESFRHGATRQMASKIVPWADYLVYFTQDAVPSDDNSIKNLLSAFADPKVGAAYGRQIARDTADPIERHSRLFNYADTSELRTIASRENLGIKAAFFSNSFAAYRRSAFDDVGGFPEDAIVSEEVTVAARMLLAGWKIAYQANAMVNHSHPLTIRKEFSRYFDIGVHHSRERWLLEEFGTARGEGLRYVKSEMQYLRENAPSLIPLAVVRTMGKWLGYQLGLHEGLLPVGLVETISAHPYFWNDRRADAMAKESGVEVTVQTVHAPRH